MIQALLPLIGNVLDRVVPDKNANQKAKREIEKSLTDNANKLLLAQTEINKVEENSKKAGFDLKCRFPIYPEFLSFINKKLRDKIAVIENEEGYVKEEYWR